MTTLCACFSCIDYQMHASRASNEQHPEDNQARQNFDGALERKLTLKIHTARAAAARQNRAQLLRLTGRSGADTLHINWAVWPAQTTDQYLQTFLVCPH